MRFVVISDTHCEHEHLAVPAGDVLVHAGDVASRGDQSELERFLSWFAQLPHAHKLLVAGNHDRFAEQKPEQFLELVPKGVTYLRDSGVTIEGIRFWGSPMTPRFYHWAFMADIGPELSAYWQLIPDATDILITHGPPRGIMDTVMHDGHLTHTGCPDLLAAVWRCQPAYHLFGHIHEGYGQAMTNGIRFINASNMNERYQLKNPAVVFDYSAQASV